MRISTVVDSRGSRCWLWRSCRLDHHPRFGLWLEIRDIYSHLDTHVLPPTAGKKTLKKCKILSTPTIICECGCEDKVHKVLSVDIFQGML